MLKKRLKNSFNKSSIKKPKIVEKIIILQVLYIVIFTCKNMCWNQTVSLNTFLFSSFVLLLMYYNYAYTQYKIPDIKNIWFLLFIASFVVMQLIEFFIWRNLNNKFYNHLFSLFALLLVLVQPFFSLMIISNIFLRNILLGIYSIFAIPTIIYSILNVNKFSSKISKLGHLSWGFVKMDSISFFAWLFFLLFGLFYEKEWPGFWFGVLTLMISFYNFLNDQSVGSMWCWSVNIILIYYACYLLLYLPFKEKMKCLF